MNEKYIKKSLLGKGSRGTVWLVENKDAGMPAALKWYDGGRKEAEREREILRRFGGRNSLFNGLYRKRTGCGHCYGICRGEKLENTFGRAENLE